MLHCGRVEDGRLEQVKDVTYSLRGFMGPSTAEVKHTRRSISMPSKPSQPPAITDTAMSDRVTMLMKQDPMIGPSVINTANDDYNAVTTTTDESNHQAVMTTHDNDYYSVMTAHSDNYNPADDRACNTVMTTDDSAMMTANDNDYQPLVLTASRSRATEEGLRIQRSISDPDAGAVCVCGDQDHLELYVQRDLAEAEFGRDLLLYPEKSSLFHCVLYLGPGDYHRFHSPVDWIIYSRRYFPGGFLNYRSRAHFTCFNQ